MKRSKGFFLTIEGGEGVGKTTLIEKLQESLSLDGHEVVTTREPGGTLVGGALRRLLLESDFHITKRAQLLMFLADRSQHVEEVILPALEDGKVVICDRFTDSTLAYQGISEESLMLTKFAALGLVPDKTFLLDLDPVVGLNRVTKIREYDRIENEGLIFHKRVRDSFLEIHKTYSERIELIDASKSMDEVFSQSLLKVKECLVQS